MGNRVETDSGEIGWRSTPGVNLFKPVGFELFSNVQEITLCTEATRRHGNAHAFDFGRLMQYSFPNSLRRIVVYGWGWLNGSVNDFVRQIFKEKGWRHDLNS